MQSSVALGTAHEGEQRLRDHPATHVKTVSRRRAAFVPRIARHLFEGPPRQLGTERLILSNTSKAVGQCLRIAGVDEDGGLAIAEHLPYRRQVACDDRPSGGHVLEQLQRRREPRRDR